MFFCFWGFSCWAFLVFWFLVFLGGFQKHDVSWVWSVRLILAAGDQLEVGGQNAFVWIEGCTRYCAPAPAALSPFRFGSLLM